MINKLDKNLAREKRQKRVRGVVFGTAEKPRLNVYRSSAHIYAQVINDVDGKTLVSSSTVAKGLKVKGTKAECAKTVGIDVAKKAKAAGINEVVFDRAGYLYTGRVKALADGAREGGLVF